MLEVPDGISKVAAECANNRARFCPCGHEGDVCLPGSFGPFAGAER